MGIKGVRALVAGATRALLLGAPGMACSVMKALKEADRAKIIEELYKTDAMTVYGRIKFGPDGANVEHPPVAVQVQNGKLVTVFPKDASEKPVWYPAKAWKERKQ